ncbi:hypothetical protein PM10SUCC1_19150 [Propionigenium maris DSM 9537]|uniref:Uncharacterized protein n=1 Tax=Propionigenium maris DSM 9537 TaxID=1123000 RepID=A0A9W6LMJ5_9FUSO|nr:hypothetical protein [Propionigenium maris]GLI56401.1 hypothetical protein PM10SUCC1_19150 [Propionigenium maris DSM 9537]
MSGKIKHTPTNEVHVLRADGKTGCGCDPRKNSSHWIKVGSGSKVTCDKNGCK